MVDNLLPEHVELPHVLDLAVHLVPLQTWVGRGGHTETFRYLANPNSRSYEWLITFSMNMENYPMSLILLSTWST